MANQAESQIKIRRAKCDSLKIYEITEGELATIERGSPNSIFLNFAIFFLSIAVAFLITLLTVNIESYKLYTIFLIICILGFMAGIFLIVLWYRNHNDFSETIKKIKARLKDEEDSFKDITKEEIPEMQNPETTEE